jgi:hypothetical protein
VLGALLDLAAQVHHRLPAVEVADSPRMADFAKVLAAVDEVHGTHGLARYRERAKRAAADTLDESFVVFTTRSASAGRGLAVDRLVVDEAEDLPAAEVGVLAPTVFSRPRAQSLYFGTAPGPWHDSEAVRVMRASAHDGLNPRLAWWEWCAQWGADIDDQDLWLRVNPAVATGRVPVQGHRR